MRVLILGSGVWIGNQISSRHGQAIYLELNKKKILVDCAPGTNYQLAKAKINSQEIEFIFLTHLHPDHFLGLPMLIGEYYQIGRREPIHIYGPPGTKKLYQDIENIYKDVYKVLKQLTKFKIEIQEIKNLSPNDLVGEDIYNNEFKVSTLLLQHQEEYPDYGYRFESEGKTIVITGDTGPCENLEKISKDCDLLIAECSLPVATRFHLCPEDIGKLGKKVHPRHIVVVHIYPQTTKELIRKGVRKYWKGKLTIPKDLMEIYV